MGLCQREEREAGRAYPRTCPTCKLGPCQKFGAKPLQSLADAQAEIARLTATLEVSQRNNRDTFDAMCAMRNAINERIPMPSMESDLLQGPENSVFCATVAEAVVSHIDKLTAERDTLRAAIFGGANYASDLRNGNFVEMAQTLHAAQKGGLARAEKAEADLATARAETAETIRSVWGRCEAAEDEAHDRLQSFTALTDHETGFWLGQKMAAKSIRRSTQMPARAILKETTHD